MLVRCETCRGQKKIARMGMLLKTCDECDGVGYKKMPDKKSQEEVIKSILEPMKEKRKYTKKVKNYGGSQ